MPNILLSWIHYILELSPQAEVFPPRHQRGPKPSLDVSVYMHQWMYACVISLFTLVNSMKIQDVFSLFDPKRHHRTKDPMLSWHFISIAWPPDCSLQRDYFHFHYYWVTSGSRYTIAVQLYHVLPSYFLTFSPCPLCSICKHWVSCHCVSMMLGFCS